jgi:HEAT repeat protein
MRAFSVALITLVAWTIAPLHRDLIPVPAASAPGRPPAPSGLSAPDPGTRATAACELAEARGPAVGAAVPALVSLLADDSSVDAISCGDGLWNEDWRTDRWVRCVTSPALEAARALAYAGRAALEPLLQALRDPRATVRQYVARALGLAEDERVRQAAVEPLSRTLEDEDENVRRTAVQVLGRLDAGRAVRPLIAALRDRAPRVRVAAAPALRDVDVPAASDALVAALEDDAWRVRRHAAWALGQIHGERY